MLNLGGGYKLYLQTLEMIRTFKEVWGLIGTSQSNPPAKSGAVPKRPTARKSTTTTPKKLKKNPIIDPLDLLKKNPTATDVTNLEELKIKEELIEFTANKERFANNNPKVPDSSDELIEVSE